MNEEHNLEICLEWSDGQQTRRITSGGSELIIGRDPDCDVPLSHPLISWHHAAVSLCASGTVTDLGATNGTFLNEERLPSHQTSSLRPDDVLRVGDIEFFCIKISQITGIDSNAYTDNGNAHTLFFHAPATGELLIGRSPSADITLAHPDVSWHHAQLKRQGDSWQLEDLSSSNGTWVNDRRISAATLCPSDRIQIGLSRLALDQAGINLSDESGHLQIEARGLWRTVFISGQPVHLLRDVSLCIRPRQLVAIAGASGAGKSTLLRALNGYAPATRGRVLINSVDFYRHREMLRSAIGYVPQDDIVHGELSVQSALRYAARLRLPSDTREDEIASLVAKTLCELDLEARRDNLIRTLSGGERKRLNIGVELLTRPGVLFLDEPTTGLDAGLERRVTQLLRCLANEGRTIVVVTHAAATLDQYDKVAFLARGGRLAFYGAPREALRFFGARDFAEVYDILNDPAQAARFNDPDPNNGSGSDAYSSNASVSSLPAPSSAAPLGQLTTLLARYAEVIRSDTRNLWFWLAQAPVIALLIALLFDNDTFASPQVRDATGDWPIHGAPRLLFLMAFSLVCFGLCNAAREIVKEQPIYERERHVSLRIGPYLLSKVLLMGAFAIVQGVVLLGVVATKIPLGFSSSEGMTALLLLFLGALNAILLGLVISALSSSADQAITLVAVLLLLQVLFSGLVPLQKLPEAMRWIASMCATRWSYGGLCGLTELSPRWNEIGLGPWVDDVMRTAPRRAIEVLCLLAGLKGALLWGALEWKDRSRR